MTENVGQFRGIKESTRFRRKRINRYPFTRDTTIPVTVHQNHWPENLQGETIFHGRKRKSARWTNTVCHRVQVWNAALSTVDEEGNEEGREGLLFRSTLNTDPTPLFPSSKATFAYPSQSLRRIETTFRHHLEIYHATLYSLPSSLFIAQRLNVDAWKVGRERVLIGNLIPSPPLLVRRRNT